MTELAKVGELGQERAARYATESVERALREPPAAKPIEIALYVNGRLVNTKTDSETVFRILGILTGLEQ